MIAPATSDLAARYGERFARGEIEWTALLVYLATLVVATA